MPITEGFDFFGEGYVLFQANERSEEVKLEKDTALIAAEKAMNAIVNTIPSEALTVAVVTYVMKQMKEILYNMSLKS